MEKSIDLIGGKIAGRYLTIGLPAGKYVLDEVEHLCTEGELIRETIPSDPPALALVAFEEKTRETVDLSDSLMGDTLLWEVPEGEWRIMRFFCREEGEVDLFDVKETSALAERLIREALKKEGRGGLKGVLIGPVSFRGTGRRDWTPLFNGFFAGRTGIDPVPLYPALFEDAGKNAEKARSALFTLRGELLSESLSSAFGPICEREGLSFAFFSEDAKITSPGWLCGDNYQLNENGSFAFLRTRGEYVYSHNAVYSIAGASLLSGKPSAALFGEDYSLCEKDTLLRDAMNFLAKGFTALACPDPAVKEAVAALLSAAGEAWRNGRPVYDVLAVYPRCALNAHVRLDRAGTGKRDLPDAPGFADYPNILNTLWNYCGVPAVLAREEDVSSARIDAKRLILSLPGGEASFPVLFLPGRDRIPLPCLEKALAFFRAGGIVFSSGELPFLSGGLAEEDEKAASLTKELFGVGENVLSLFDPCFVNTSRNGGYACFIPSSEPMADGSGMPSPSLLKEQLSRSGYLPDVEIKNMPRVFHRGIMNLPYRVFRNLNVAKDRSVGGFFGFCHKTGEAGDVRFFSNTSSLPFEGEIKLRGMKGRPFCVDPLGGRSFSPPFSKEGERTVVSLSLPSVSCVFLFDR